MTREEFLSGKPFNPNNFGNNRAYVFVEDKTKTTIGFVTYLGLHDSNIRKVTNTFVYGYSSILGKTVDVKIRLSDLHC
jgi:hypothetical protein